jgi:hypothetical protein
VAEQREFHKGLKSFPVEYRQAGNEIKKSEVYRRANIWKRGFGQRLRYAVRSWEGAITDISTDQGGGRASVSIVCETQGFRVYYKSGLRLERGSPLYKAVREMNEGDRVVFSGKFIPDEERGLREESLTERGSLSEPEFLLDFEEIRKK